jgi:hypothetical protein
MRALKPKTTDALAIAPVLISDESAPAACGLTSRRFRELIAKHKIPCVRDGHRVLVRARDLEALVDRVADEANESSDAAENETGPRTPAEVLALVGRVPSRGGR